MSDKQSKSPEGTSKAATDSRAQADSRWGRLNRKLMSPELDEETARELLAAHVKQGSPRYILLRVYNRWSKLRREREHREYCIRTGESE